MGLDASDVKNNSLDIRIRLAEIDAEFKAMPQAIATDTVENFDKQRALQRSWLRRATWHSIWLNMAMRSKKKRIHSLGWMRFLLSWMDWRTTPWSTMTD
jgi:hypothetical protein